ncbi:MAG TPA: hypothetical protein VLV76_07095 [Candidatus Acidoferrum sp.]|nr:hypothetical protein [Candidatus Acidoferrum sp.]
MAKRPNYGQERAERQRRKAARRDERLAAKAERRHQPPDTGSAAAPEALAEPGPLLPADPIAMGRLAQVLKFVCGDDHPTTLAVKRAAMSSDGADIERARALFQQLTPGNQRAALTLVAATPSTLR